MYSQYIYTHIHVHVYIYIYIHIRIHMCIYTYVCVCVLYVSILYTLIMMRTYMPDAQETTVLRQSLLFLPNLSAKP